MNKSLLVLCALFATGAWAQQPMSPELYQRVHTPVPYTKKTLTGTEQNGSSFRGSGSPAQVNSQNGTVLGTTTYDLQTNASIQNRFVRHGDGTMSAVFTYSNSYDLASTDRGTGYVYNNGTSWSGAPTSRIETQRCGWPSILSVNGGEVNTVHNNTSQVITMNRRPVKGTGAWTEANVTQSTIDLIWNRSAVGGPNGQTVHMIGVTAPVANNGALYQGLDGALLYYRSLDGGATWDRQDVVLPQLSSQDWIGFSGDTYAITARGSTVAFAIFDGWKDVVVMKSTDNGNTWTKSIALDFPLDRYEPDQPGGSDINGDGMFDTLTCADGAGAIVLDGNDMAHVFFGKFIVLDDDLSDGNTSYFPFLSDSMLYWNEDMGEGNYTAIAGAEDRDNNGAVINPNETAASTALYFTALAGNPHAVYDNVTGSIFTTFNMYLEDVSNGAQSYRHIFMFKSDDLGCTWTEPVDYTNNGSGFEECVFASIASDVTDSIRFLYQEDLEPGLAVRGDEDAYSLNEMVLVAVDKASLPSTPNVCASYINASALTFCAGDSVELTASCGTSYAWSTGGSTQAVSVTTYGTYTCTITTACGQQVESVTLSAPSTGPDITISATALEICPGSNPPVTLTASSASQASYLWSTGFTTQGIDIINPGTYTVSVTNCGGTTVETITINQPTQAPTPVITGDQTICPGGTVTLTATNVVSGSYLWSTGSTALTTQVTATGTYTVTATNCAGTGTASINVTAEPLPMGTTNVTGPTTFCEGDATVTLSATDGTSWTWSNTDTTQSITLSTAAQSGSYTVTSFNACGDQATSNAIDVTIHPAAQTPTITYNGDGTYTASSPGATAFQWFINSNAIAGETSATFDASNDPNLIGSDISVEITDANGCSAMSTGQVVSVEDVRTMLDNITIFPNPSDGLFNIGFETSVPGAYTIRMTNTVGQVVLDRSISLGSGQHIEQIQTTNFNQGLYFLTISNGEVENVHKVVLR
ncbi:MAG: T9SS type A sorting domain-containing protein [Leptolyngbya sp. SIO3F4]|nr:T9SS type A sorting domain-containing protein [Leptolyngbya sp. SIO3F4]